MFEYDAANRLVETTDRNERVRKFEYDALGRMTSEEWYQDGDDQTADETFTFSYDAMGHMLTAADTSSFDYAYSYDDLGRVDTHEQEITGLTPHVYFDNAYDLNGRRTQSAVKLGADSTWTEDYVNDYVYDALGRTTKISQDAQSDNAVADKRVDFTYDEASRYDDITRYSDIAGVLPASVYESFCGLWYRGCRHINLWRTADECQAEGAGDSYSTGSGSAAI